MTKAEFLNRYRNDYRFRNDMKNQGVVVIGDCVIMPTGKTFTVAGNHVK